MWPIKSCSPLHHCEIAANIVYHSSNDPRLPLAVKMAPMAAAVEPAKFFFFERRSPLIDSLPIAEMVVNPSATNDEAET